MNDLGIVLIGLSIVAVSLLTYVYTQRGKSSGDESRAQAKGDRQTIADREEALKR